MSCCCSPLLHSMTSLALDLPRLMFSEATWRAVWWDTTSFQITTQGCHWGWLEWPPQVPGWSPPPGGRAGSSGRRGRFLQVPAVNLKKQALLVEQHIGEEHGRIGQGCAKQNEMSSRQRILEIITNLADHANVKVFLYFRPVAPVPETI